MDITRDLECPESAHTSSQAGSVTSSLRRAYHSARRHFWEARWSNSSSSSDNERRQKTLKNIVTLRWHHISRILGPVKLAMELSSLPWRISILSTITWWAPKYGKTLEKYTVNATFLHCWVRIVNDFGWQHSELSHIASINLPLTSITSNDFVLMHDNFWPYIVRVVNQYLMDAKPYRAYMRDDSSGIKVMCTC